ncbi:MerR family transcriptional regulator [Agrococcus jejuensis]|uniref:DNA-binding transcriptional regulator, MerR family n=1 Tax=Agrococcus jejuensis TaxID=399736 RepID=A0A1G8FVU4_9MICO|nr:MerR family transcriptional regulator [Agrococcus jejuensis]SDH86086.1 DNA-binding transcriptional regulator, MerR family [Agrococcus jejuensis]
MAWSTRELAELAGTTLKTVRHYHSVGLLPEPERRVNGYKQYGAAHLVRLLRIRRLVDLGIPLARIGDMVDDPGSGTDALRALDEELGEQIARLQRVRDEVSSIVEHGAPADLPEGFSSVAGNMNAADRALMLVYSRLYDDEGMQQMREMVGALGRTPLDDELEALPDDADDATRQELAERFAPYLADIRARWSWVNDPSSHASRSPAEMQATVVRTMLEIYSVAQLDVMARADAILGEQQPEAAADDA